VIDAPTIVLSLRVVLQGSVGATIRVYIEKYESNPDALSMPTAVRPCLVTVCRDPSLGSMLCFVAPTAAATTAAIDLVVRRFPRYRMRFAAWWRARWTCRASESSLVATSRR
jgi:hypothetical protein